MDRRSVNPVYILITYDLWGEAITVPVYSRDWVLRSWLRRQPISSPRLLVWCSFLPLDVTWLLR